MSKTVTLAFYGSLRKGGVWYDSWDIGRCKFVGKGRIPGALFILGGGVIPGIVHHDTRTVVVEVYEFPENMMGSMDSFEHSYRRTPVTVTLEDGTAVEAQTYFLPVTFERITSPDYYDRHADVEDGDYMEWIKNNQPRAFRA